MIAVKRLIIALLIVPPAFELTVRLDDLVRYGVPVASGATNIMDLRVDDAQGRHARAATTYRKFHINALGFRGPEVDAAALRTGPLVAVTGASETFGLYESAGREWPRQLSDSLAAACGATPPVVVNTAFAGMSLPTVIQDIELRVLPLKPAVVVYYPEPAQYLFARVPSRAPLDRVSEQLSPWSLRSYARLRENFKSIVPEAVLDLNRRRQTVQQREDGEELFTALPVERLDTMEAHLRILVGAVRAGGSQLVFVVPRHRLTDTIAVSEKRWLRAWEAVLPKAPGAMILAFADSGDVRLRRVASDSAVRLIDPPFPTGPERQGYFADPNHFTDSGAALLAGGASMVVADLLGCRR